ncbi:MAG: glycoside hydrolase family 2 TIM barrel-domain containing protein [Alistipes sp.]
MRTIFSILTLFSLCGAAAQEYTPSYGREASRGALIAYPTEQEAMAADSTNNRYLSRLTAWTSTANTFTTAFTVPFAWANRQVLLHLDSASADYEVRINGKAVAYNANGNTPTDFNITRAAKEGRNTLEIVLSTPSRVAPLESWKEAPTPSIGGAWLLSQPTLRVRDVLTKTWYGEGEDKDKHDGSDDGSAMAEVALVIQSNALNPRTSRIHYELLTPSGETAAAGHKDMTLDMRREDTLRFMARIPSNLLWSSELPTLYTLRVRTQHEGRYVEYLELHPGFRVVSLHDGQLSVNRQPVTLRVRKVPAQISDNQIAALREQGYNALQLQTGTIRPTFYDFCDLQGLYVIAPPLIDTRRSGTSRRIGGNPSNNPAWLAAYLERTADSYNTTKFHPSVIAFTLAEKSANGINLYESYLKMKQFGDSRPFIYLDAGGEWNSDRLKLQ